MSRRSTNATSQSDSLPKIKSKEKKPGPAGLDTTTTVGTNKIQHEPRPPHVLEGTRLQNKLATHLGLTTPGNHFPGSASGATTLKQCVATSQRTDPATAHLKLPKLVPRDGTRSKHEHKSVATRAHVHLEPTTSGNYLPEQGQHEQTSASSRKNKPKSIATAAGTSQKPTYADVASSPQPLQITGTRSKLEHKSLATRAHLGPTTSGNYLPEQGQHEQTSASSRKNKPKSIATAAGKSQKPTYADVASSLQPLEITGNHLSGSASVATTLKQPGATNRRTDADRAQREHKLHSKLRPLPNPHVNDSTGSKHEQKNLATHHEQATLGNHFPDSYRPGQQEQTSTSSRKNERKSVATRLPPICTIQEECPSQPDLSEAQRLVHRDAAEVEPIDGTFVDDVVRTFEGQRIQGYQFAVLVLSPECQVTLRHMPAYAMTNSSSPTHPPDHTLQNYIVARPDGDHAEVLLLQRFPTLLARNTPGCQSIVLYSWFLPCQDCAEKIACVLGQCTTTHRVTVVYTSTLTKNEDKDRKYIGIMEAAGIAVRKCEYNHELHRMSRRARGGSTTPGPTRGVIPGGQGGPWPPPTFY